MKHSANLDSSLKPKHQLSFSHAPKHWSFRVLRLSFDWNLWINLSFPFPQIPASPSHTYQCVNGHIVCEKCRPKTARCPMCRVQLGRGRCLVADKILRYLQTNSAIRIGPIGEVEKTSPKIDELEGQKSSEKMSLENRKSTENLHAKNSTCLPFKIKLKTITFWKDA